MILFKTDTEIKGNADVDGYKDQIQLSSFQLGVGRAISSAGASTDRETSTPSWSEATCTMETNIASTAIAQQAAGGKSLGKGIVSFVNIHDNKPQCYLKITMHDLIISSYSMSSGGDRPSESFSANYLKIEFEYNQFDGATVKATTTSGWDLKKGVAV